MNKIYRQFGLQRFFWLIRMIDYFVPLVMLLTIEYRSFVTGNLDLYLLSGYCFKNDSTFSTRSALFRAFAFVLLFGRIGAQAKPPNKI